MTAALVIDIKGPGGDWQPGAVIRPGDRPGANTDNNAGGRDVILFECQPARPVIYRSTAGADWTAGDGRLVMFAGGTETIAELGPGESYERTIRTDRDTTFTVRWTHHQVSP